jgi:rod shape-determining protein MreD
MSTHRLTRGARLLLVLLSLLIVQVGVVADLRVFGAMGDLMLLVAIAAGSVSGPNRGAAYGFWAGVTYDLLLETPFGLSPLVYALVGYAVGIASAWYVEARAWYHVAVAGLASMIGVAVLVGVALGLGVRYPLEDVARIAPVAAVWSALLILPFRRMLRWVIGEEEPERFRMVIP